MTPVERILPLRRRSSAAALARCSGESVLPTGGAHVIKALFDLSLAVRSIDDGLCKARLDRT
ncbi:protein of unknown function (plasmid) [Methylocella tundrae]|uniref:Uncharacterized protein n=1 Tax=Methylocella tundrae TaxID=227605 RepID=A0A4U8Z7U7_METTU|nr:protein of unknown function [Methylocella tundrae]